MSFKCGAFGRRALKCAASSYWLPRQAREAGAALPLVLAVRPASVRLGTDLLAEDEARPPAVVRVLVGVLLAELDRAHRKVEAVRLDRRDGIPLRRREPRACNRQRVQVGREYLCKTTKSNI